MKFVAAIVLFLLVILGILHCTKAGRLSGTNITRTSERREAIFYKKFPNHKLVAPTIIKTVSNVSHALCCRACLREQTCESFNHNDDSGAICELLNITSIEGGYVSPAVGWNHYQATEKLMLPCMRYHLTGNSGEHAYALYHVPVDESNVAKLCDQNSDGGGWTQIARYTRVKSHTQTYRNNLLGDDLAKLRSTNFFMSFDTFLKFRRTFAFRQMRWACGRSLDSHKFDIATMDNAVGDAVINHLAKIDDKLENSPPSCGSFYQVDGLESVLGKNCEKWNEKKWGFLVESQKRLYKWPFGILGVSSFNPESGSCDALSSSNDGSVYLIYVR